MAKVMTVKQFSWLVFFALLFAIALTTLVFFYTEKSITSANNQWHQSHQEIYQQHQIIKEIYATIGYGGFIHHFKNYLLRQDSVYFTSAQNNINHALYLLDKYKNANISVPEKVSLEALEKTFAHYQTNLFALKELHNQPLSIAQKDAQVKISDVEAIKALNELTFALESRQSNSTNALDNAIADTIFYSESFGYFVIAILICIAISSIRFIQLKLLRPIESISQGITNYAKPYYQKLTSLKRDKSSVAELQTLVSSLNDFISAKYNYQQELASTQQQLLKNEQLLKSILRNISEGIAICDASGKITTFNKVASEIFGYATYEIAGHSICKLIHTAETERICDFLVNDDLLAHIINTRVELVGQRKNQSEFPSEFACSEITHENTTYYCIVIRDLTQRKLREERLKTLIKDAKQAAEEKSEFISAISHEFRTPLNTILGFSQLLTNDKSQPSKSKFNEFLTEITAAADRLLQQINDILDIANLEAKAELMTISNIKAGPWLSECIDLITPSASTQNITFINACDSDLPMIFIDELKAQQAVLNLLSNAIKFSPINATITIDSKIIDNRFLRLSISDKGLGIKNEDQSKVFKKFERLGYSTSKIEGTGLGLYLTKQLVELQHGRIGFSSSWQQGSCFWLDFPLSRAYHPTTKNSQLEKL